jgi:hypothetical protein
MKTKLLNLLLLTTSFFGYLQWSGNSHMFLFEAEVEIFKKLFTDPGSVVHPFILFPLGGQLILIFTLFQKEPGKVLTFLALGALSLLFLLMFFIGLISLNLKILLSTIPFIIIGIITVRTHLKKNKQ